VELGSYALNRLRRKPIIEFYAWTAPPTTKKARNDPGKSRHDPLRLARYYQSLLDTGKFESRAALARFLGVSRANVTKVLNRLKNVTESAAFVLLSGTATG
jgi:predicted metal-dependent peptidase